MNIQELSDRAEIQQTLLLYYRGIDRLDYDLILSCFFDDAVVDYGMFFRGSPGGFVDWLDTPEGLLGFNRTMHFAGNMVIEVEGDVAKTETYCISFHQALPEHVWAGAFVPNWLRYLDRFERREGQWRIAERRVLMEWARRESMDGELKFPDAMRGRRDKTDPVYRN
jgi:hypothetical protein